MNSLVMCVYLFKSYGKNNAFNVFVFKKILLFHYNNNNNNNN